MKSFPARLSRSSPLPVMRHARTEWPWTARRLTRFAAVAWRDIGSRVRLSGSVSQTSVKALVIIASAFVACIASVAIAAPPSGAGTAMGGSNVGAEVGNGMSGMDGMGSVGRIGSIGSIGGGDNAGTTANLTAAVPSGLELAQATGVTYPREGAGAPVPPDSRSATRQPAAVPLATDFAAHARRAASLDAPLIVLVSLRDCVYCGPIRQRELAPLVRSGKYEVREIGMDSTTPVRDFDGATTTGVAWARAHGVKVSPTVLFLDTNGRPVADPLIGAGLPDFYGAYLDDAIAHGRARLPTGSATTTR
ncbi:hypothetical protein [Pandoraea anhela]|nr:hypothetical protein [Pandoraea anhela]